jgi:esterase/lipase superfamily enzyme
MGATVVDLTDVASDDSSNHGKFSQLAEVAPQLRAVLAGGIGAGAVGAASDGSPLGAVTLLSTTVLSAPVKIFAGQ